MPRRVFKYSSEAKGVIEVTPESDRELCEAISQDVATRNTPFEGSLPGEKKGEYKNVAGHWPIHSWSQAVNPSQVKEAQRRLALQGVKTEYDKQGRPILRDRAHKKAHYRAVGAYDGDAGYGDAEPLNYRSDMTRANIMKEAKAEQERLQKELYQMLRDQ